MNDFLLVVLLLISTLSLLIANRFPTDLILLAALCILLITGVLSPVEVLAGFSNPGIFTIAMLYVVVSGLRETGTIGWLSQLLLGRPSNLTMALLRLIVPAATLSSFINNSPIVAMFTGAGQDWCKRSGHKPSNFLLPLSYASILGGTCSLIGTSTNLVIDGMMQQQGFKGLELFELAALGIPLTLLGVVYLLLISPLLLSRQSAAIEQFSDTREYLVEMLVKSGCDLAGQSIQDAGLRNLPGLFLIEVVRGNEVISVTTLTMVIQPGDRLVFAGAVDSVVELRKIRGLFLADDQVFKLEAHAHERRLFEAVVSADNPIVGSNIRQSRFRHRYNAVILSISRNGKRLAGRIGDINIQPGDTLLLEAQKGFLFKFRNSRDFLLVSRLDNSNIVRHERGAWAMAIILLMIGLMLSGLLTIMQSATLAAALMLCSGCVNPEEARRSIDYQVLLVIACAFALGLAIQKVGLSDFIALQALTITKGEPWLVLAMIYFLTVLLTEMITNNAAAIVMFPIALSTAQNLNLDMTPFAVTVMIAASASFITPIGYQTNLMVFGPGGYRFMDYVKLGLPLSLMVAAMSIGLIPLFWPF